MDDPEKSTPFSEPAPGVSKASKDSGILSSEPGSNLSKTTAELMNILSSANREKELSEYIDRLEEIPRASSFHSYLLSLLEEKALKKADLVKKSGLERTYCYQLLNGTRRPGRDNAILLCIAAGLNLTETQRALEISNLGILYAKNRRDAILIFCINKCLSVADTEELLDRFGEKTLRDDN